MYILAPKMDNSFSEDGTKGRTLETMTERLTYDWVSSVMTCPSLIRQPPFTPVRGYPVLHILKQ